MSSLEELQAEKQSILEELKKGVATLSDLHNERQESIGCLNSLIKAIEKIVATDEKVADAIKDVIDKELKETIFSVEKLSSDVSNLQVAFDNAVQASFDPLLKNLKTITTANSSELEMIFEEASKRIQTIREDVSSSAENAQKLIQSKFNEFEDFLTHKSSDLTERLSMLEDKLEPVVVKSASVADKLFESVNAISSSTTQLQQKDSQFRHEMSALIKDIVREELKSQLEVVVMNTRQLSKDLGELKNKKSGLFGGILK